MSGIELLESKGKVGSSSSLQPLFAFTCTPPLNFFLLLYSPFPELFSMLFAYIPHWCFSILLFCIVELRYIGYCVVISSVFFSFHLDPHSWFLPKIVLLFRYSSSLDHRFNLLPAFFSPYTFLRIYLISPLSPVVLFRVFPSVISSAVNRTWFFTVPL